MIGAFVLKRIGKCSDGKNDTLEMKSVVTRIGRHSMNTYVMDSKEFPCLISRWHSAIIREETNGVVQYFVFDCKSVNGTFVNNVKIPQEKNVLLKDGDVVTFGCRGGNSISVGGRTTEDFSEFRYMFTRNGETNRAQQNSTGMSHEAGDQASFRSPPNGVNRTDSPSDHPHITSAFTDQKNNVTTFYSDISQPSSKVHSLPLKNALNNSAGHLTLHSEQRTPVTGSQKRKNKRGSMPPSDFSENGSAPKNRKIADNEVNVGETKAAKQQKIKRKTRKAFNDSDDELCSAFNCLKPRSATLSWVQCDDCDEWFHVDCIKTIKEDCNLEKLEDAEFHCGCV